ncbi:Transglutaminase-like superfamily protein [Roseivivax jejudonensis]|uniref:Transglutaminase-like superfamily protein n=1 Tax=Roseivivax jejudonensis TaxID=1529041 RepID=A0A1X7A9T8_9RHOB|nr:transglutaminase family protein [Roseivivax jejudonensis]SLN74084.1 Transglutaminase-like superfamily protein [Roseivivax jejudonensis]
MKLRIRHVSTFAFDAPVKRLVQSHRLSPTDTASQRIMAWNVDTGPASIGAAFRDGAGDWTQTVSLRGPLETFTVTVEGEVETQDQSGVLRGHREHVPPSAYLTSTRRTALTAELRGLAAEASEGTAPGRSLDRAHALCRAVHDAVAYVPGSTEAATTASEALEGGRGVCQDHAQVLIALAHACEIPARYVAGYLMSTEDSVGAEASHAWAELHVDGLGWVGFDAANACCPDARYVRLCSGYDAADGAPIRGVIDGAAEESLDVSVAVLRDGQSQSQSQG